MNYRSTLFTALVLLGSTLGAPTAPAQSTSADSPLKLCSVPPAEVAVYKSFLQPESSEPNVVLTTTYTHHGLDVDSLNLQLAVQGRGIPPDVREDFKKKNTKSCNIEPFGGIDKLNFLSESDHKHVFEQGWKEFHKRLARKRR